VGNIKNIFDVIGYIAAGAWVVMFLYVSNSMAEHEAAPHAGAATKLEIGEVRIDVTSNAQAIAANEKFNTMVRETNSREHTRLEKKLDSNAVVLANIWTAMKE